MRRNAGRAGERQAGATGNQHRKVAGGGDGPNSNWKLSFKYNLYPKSGQVRVLRVQTVCLWSKLSLNLLI